MFPRLSFYIGLLFLSLFVLGVMFYIWVHILDSSFENDSIKRVMEWILIIAFVFFGVSFGAKAKSRKDK